MLVDFAAELFDALFDHYPWGRGTRRFEEGKRQIEKEVEGEIDEVDADEMETDDRLREAKLRWEIDGQIRDKEKRERYETVFIGSLNIIAGHPDPLPPSDMLDRLRGLQLPYTSYVPDEDEPSQDLIAAAYVRGATLFTTWLLSGYGDDIQPTHRELENLLVRLNSVRLDSINPLDQTRSLSRRVGAELAFQRGDYSEALTGMANSISPLYDDEIDDAPPDLNDPQFAPWLSDVEVRATECIEAIEHDDNVDWPVVVRACELLSRCFFDVSEYVGLRTFDEDLDTQHAFWNERSGWARAKLTPDRLRNLLKQQDDESAAQRVETYFFADGRWERLPERAQRALVTADRMLISPPAAGMRSLLTKSASRPKRCCTTTCGYRYRNGSERNDNPIPVGGQYSVGRRKVGAARASTIM